MIFQVILFCYFIWKAKLVHLVSVHKTEKLHFGSEHNILGKGKNELRKGHITLGIMAHGSYRIRWRWTMTCSQKHLE